MKNKKLISFLLAAVMISASFVSCAETEDKSAEVTDNSVEVQTEEETEETGIRSLSNVPELDFEGTDFVINCRETCDSVDVDEITGEVVNDAVYSRNRMTEEALNVVISQMKDGDTTCSQTKNSIIAGDRLYTATVTHINQMCSMLQNGYFYNIDSVPYLDMTMPYWAHGVAESLEVAGKRYLFSGDISILDDANIWCIYFNKDLILNLGLDNPYEAMEAGKWTFDFYISQIEKGAADLDGDGKWSWDKDQFALLNPQETLCGMYNGMGQMSIVRNSDNNLVMNMGTETSVTAIQKISDWFQTGTGTTFLEAAQINSNEKWEDLWKVFAAGRALYYNHVIAYIVECLRDMENEFGILPMPKYDETQTNYVSSTQEWGQCVYAVPLCTKDVNLSGAVLEYMCGLSTDTVRSAYYDVALTRKYSRDTESVRSLDILFNNVVIDPGFCYLSCRDTVNKALTNGNAASTIEKAKKLNEKQIQKLEEAISKLQQ